MYMKQRHINSLKTALVAVCFIAYPLSFAQEEIGVAAAVNTKTVDMVAFPGGNIENRNVDPGYKIISNRTIQTNTSGKAQMLLVDGTAFTIGPNSSVTLDKFIYDPATASGSLEVSAKGLIRLVGGKVTKKKPAIIKTSTATVGIRGGIAIVEATDEETTASFVYGVEMEVAPIKNPENSLTLTQVGLKVEVEADSEEVEEPEVITSEELDEYAEDFEGNEEPEESSDDSESEESTNDSEESSENEETEENEEEVEESEEEAEENEEETEEEAEENEEEAEENEEEAEENEEGAEETEEADETEDSEEESDELESEETEEQDNEESEETESEEVEEETENDELEDSEELTDNSSEEESDEEDASSETANKETPEETSNSEESSDSETQDNENSSDTENDSPDETASQEPSDTDDEPSENNSPIEASSSDQEASSGDSSETTSIDTEDDPQDQSSENADSNDGISVETQSSDTSNNTTNNDSSNDQFSGESDGNVETQPTSEESQTTPEVQGPTVTSSSSSNDVNRPTQPNQGRDIKEPPLTRPTEEPATAPGQVTSSPSSDPVPLTQPATATSSSDQVPLVQPPTSTASSDSAPLILPSTATTSSDAVPLIQPDIQEPEVINIEPIENEPITALPEIDEGLLDSFDITTNTSDTGIDDLTTAYDAGGELFFDDAQIDTQEDDFIEEATEANEEVQIEEVQEEQKVEVVIEAQLTTNASFIKTDIEENLLAGASLGKIDVNYTGSENLSFVLGGNGSENFEIDAQGNITLKNNLDYEARTTYSLLVFTLLGEKSITNTLDFNVVDIDEDPIVDLNLSVNSLAENTATNFKIGEVQITDPEQNGVTSSITGIDQAKVAISSSGEITLQDTLDFETKEQLEFIVEVFDGKNTVQTPVSIQLDNINDLTANVDYTDNLLHEGADIDSTVANINVNGDSTLSYSLSGTNSSDFRVTSDGKIKVAQNLDHSSKDIYDLVLRVEGRHDNLEVPVSISIKANEAPIIATDCFNSCSVKELASIGTTVIQSSRQDNDTDSVTYSLIDNFDGKFSIDQNTGAVSIAGKIDYESQSSFNLEIQATDSKNLTDIESVPLNIGDVVPVSQVSYDVSSTNVEEVKNEFVVLETADEASDTQQKILTASSNFTDNDSTFAISGQDAEKFEINAATGELSIKDLGGANVSGLNFEDQKTYQLTITESRTDEGPSSQDITINAKNIENDAASVLRYSAAFNNEQRIGFMASADRGISGSQDNKPVRESILTFEDIEASSSVTSVDSKGYIRKDNTDTESTTTVFSNTQDNGKNENSTDSLDWKYVFPVEDNPNSSIDRIHKQHSTSSVALLASNDAETSQSISSTVAEIKSSDVTNYRYEYIHNEINGLINANNDGSSPLNGDDLTTEFQTNGNNLGREGKLTINLSQDFNFFDQTFSTIYVSENGYASFSNSTLDASNDFITGFPIQFLNPGTEPIDGMSIPDGWKGTNLNYSLFPFWTDLDALDPDSKFYYFDDPTNNRAILGWYNFKERTAQNDNSRANFEIVLNYSNMSVEFRYGNISSDYPLHDNHNTMVGIAGDLNQNEFEQFYYHVRNGRPFGSAGNIGNRIFKYIQNPNDVTDGMVAKANQELEPVSSLTYSPEGNPSPASDDIFESNEIKSAAIAGSNNEFLWMNLDKAAVNIDYQTSSNNDAGGYDVSSPNYLDGSSGAASYISATYNLLEDQITLAGKPYTDNDFKTLLEVKGISAKEVLAFAPIPIEYSARFKNPNFLNDYASYFLPQFLSSEYMQTNPDGSDRLFDFDLLQEDNYCKFDSSLNCGFSSRDVANRQYNAVNDDNYKWASVALTSHQGASSNLYIKTDRFFGSSDWTPYGQSLWYQVFKNAGRGVGLFAQINFNCEGSGYCGSESWNSSETQSSLFSVLINDVSKRSLLDGYFVGDSGYAMSGQHYFSYSRKNNRISAKDGIHAQSYDTPQLVFGLNPISCASSRDYGCFWGSNNQDSNVWTTPKGAMITTSDPYREQSNIYKSGGMDLGIMYAMAENYSEDPDYKNYHVGSFNQGIAVQDQIDGNGNKVSSTSLDEVSNSWRSQSQSSNDNWSGYINGLLNIDDKYPQLLEGSINITFDGQNDRVKISSNDSQFYKLPFLSSDTSLKNSWYRTGANATLIPFSYGNQNNQNLIPLGTGHFALQFGDDEENNLNKDFAQSAYLNKSVFGAITKDQNTTVKAGSTSISDNLTFQKSSDTTGALITWETIDNPDQDFVQNAVIPDLDYMSWGFWAMATNDIADDLYNDVFDGRGEQTAAVHMGTWFAGDLIDQADLPVNYQATLSGAAIFNVFTRLNDASHRYVASGIASGNLNFSNTGWTGTLNISEADKASANAAVKNWNASFNLSSTDANFLQNFSCAEVSSSSICSGVRGSLYGTENNIEMGAQFKYTVESLNSIYMAEGISILSE